MDKALLLMQIDYDLRKSKATFTEIVKLDARVIELESRFRHRHVSNGVNDACKECRFDLRDPIHEKVQP